MLNNIELYINCNDIQSSWCYLTLYISVTDMESVKIIIEYNQFNKISRMLTYSTQLKILNDILKNPSNKQCADCNSISPTWASLQFGVFVCQNCAGAHRSLGPTVTRVKSAHLDNWQSSWIEKMRIGNQQLNRYWEGNPTHRKPKIGATSMEIHRYVSDKYLKKKFACVLKVDPSNEIKNNQCPQMCTEPTKNNAKTECQDLLDFEDDQIVNDQQENQFTDFMEANHPTNSTKQQCILKEQFSNIIFQDLLQESEEQPKSSFNGSDVGCTMDGITLETKEHESTTGMNSEFNYWK